MKTAENTFIRVKFDETLIGYQTDTPFDIERVRNSILKAMGKYEYPSHWFHQVPNGKQLTKLWNKHVESEFYEAIQKNRDIPLTKKEMANLKEYVDRAGEYMIGDFIRNIALLGY